MLLSCNDKLKLRQRKSGGIETSPCHAVGWLQLYDRLLSICDTVFCETVELVIVPIKLNSLRNSPTVQAKQRRPWF